MIDDIAQEFFRYSAAGWGVNRRLIHALTLLIKRKKRKTTETGACLLANGHSYFFLVYGISRARTNRPVGCCWSTCQARFPFHPFPISQKSTGFSVQFRLPFLRSFSLFIFVFRRQSLVGERRNSTEENNKGNGSITWSKNERVNLRWELNCE